MMTFIFLFCFLMLSQDLDLSLSIKDAFFLILPDIAVYKELVGNEMLVSVFKLKDHVQSLSHVRLFVTPWTAANEASPSFNISQSLLKLMSIELAMPSSHLILCRPLFLLPSIFPSIRIFSNESALHIR